jgi:hypothetical protein
VHVYERLLHKADDTVGGNTIRQQLAEYHATNDDLGAELLLLTKHIYYRRIGASEAHSSRQIDDDQLIAEVDVSQVSVSVLYTIV